MKKLTEIEGDMLRLTPDGKKLAEDLRAGRGDDGSFDQAIQSLIDKGLMTRDGDNLSITEKGEAVYRAFAAVEAAANTKLADILAVHDQLELRDEIKRIELRDEIKRILDSDQDATVENGIAIARPKGGSNW
jgi:superfamily II helicase